MRVMCPFVFAEKTWEVRYTPRMPKRKPTNAHESKLRKAGHRLIAGVDEAGKGSWAGPLVTAAVIIDEANVPEGLNDSKVLTPKQRERLFVHVTRRAVSWTAHIVPVSEIDKHGVHRANLAALKRAVEKLHVAPDAVLVDAFAIDLGRVPVVHVIDGDALERTIGAASIIAKVVRDRIMSSELHRQYPHFHFHVHKGYGTAQHAKLLAVHGPTPEHRTSFRPVQDALSKASRTKKRAVPSRRRTSAKKKSITKKPKRAARRAPRKSSRRTAPRRR